MVKAAQQVCENPEVTNTKRINPERVGEMRLKGAASSCSTFPSSQKTEGQISFVAYIRLLLFYYSCFFMLLVLCLIFFFMIVGFLICVAGFMPCVFLLCCYLWNNKCPHGHKVYLDLDDHITVIFHFITSCVFFRLSHKPAHGHHRWWC